MCGQNVDIQVNAKGTSETKDDCGYRINGICTSEDLGGVEVSRGKSSHISNVYHLEFTNYNDFAVSVIFEVGDIYSYAGTKTTGTIILRPDETKETVDAFKDAGNFCKILF